ncbi:MAG: alpha/beta hydrolase [Polyangiaceae bacterium]
MLRIDGGPHLPVGEARWLVARSARRLRTALFRPEASALGTVVLSPGRSEPIEKYGEVALDFLKRGFVVLLHDWAGQGLSQRFQADRTRGDVDGGWRAFLSDYLDVVLAHAAQLPRPWLAVGHSMGGALTALALTELDVRFDGVALCAPMMEFATGPVPTEAARRIASLAVRLGLGPRLARERAAPARVAFERNLLTHDRERYEQAVALYAAHPELSLGEPTWRWLKFGFDLRERLSAPGAAERIRCPLLVVAAGDDRIVHNEPIRRFVARAPRGRYVEVPGAWHEVLMEREPLRARFFEEFERLSSEAREHRAHSGG